MVGQASDHSGRTVHCTKCSAIIQVEEAEISRKYIKCPACNYWEDYQVEMPDELKKCPNCDSMQDSDSVYCSNCGQRIQQVAVTKIAYCEKCEAEYDPSLKYCKLDGSKLVIREVERGTEATNTPISAGNGNLDSPAHNGPKIREDGSSRSDREEGNNRNPLKNVPKWDRFLANLIDVILISAMSIPGYLILMAGRDPIYIYLAVIFYIVPIWYGATKEGLKDGQSIGKKARDLMVIVLASSTPCTKTRSVARWGVSLFVATVAYASFILINTVDSFVIFCLFMTILLIEPLMVLIRKDGRKLADMLTGVQVIRTSEFSDGEISADEIE